MKHDQNSKPLKTEDEINIILVINKGVQHKLLNHDKQFKTASKKTIQKIVEATGDVVANKNADKITKVSRSSSQDNSETVTIEHD